MVDKDHRSVTELLSAAIDWTQCEGEGDWTAVTALQWIGTEEVLRAALGLADSDDPRERALAAHILGQLGVPTRTFPAECLDAVLRLLNTDSDPTVLEAAAIALKHLEDSRGSEPLAKLIHHSDDRVRYAVAFALGGRSDATAVEALIRLTHDSNALVRDWATYGLGQRGKLNTLEIREALFRRIHDEDRTTRFEAICGLVRCGDDRAIAPLIAALIDDPEDAELWLPAFALLKIEDDDSLTASDLVSMLKSLRPSICTQLHRSGC